jgi:hypothetical protein
MVWAVLVALVSILGYQEPFQQATGSWSPDTVIKDWAVRMLEEEEEVLWESVFSRSL